MQTYDMNPDRRARIEAAEEAAEELNKGLSFKRWMDVGVGVNDMEQEAIERSGSQDNQSHAYRLAWRALAAAYPHISGLAKTERSLASWMATNREAVEGWHARLDDRKRRAINTPRAVYNNHPLGRASREAARVRTTPRRTEQPATKSDVAEIIGEITRVSDGTPKHFDLAPEHIRESGQNWIAIYGLSDTMRWIVTLQELVMDAALPEPPVADRAFEQSLAKPPRKRRGTKALDDPTRPRNA